MWEKACSVFSWALITVNWYFTFKLHVDLRSWCIILALVLLDRSLYGASIAYVTSCIIMSLRLFLTFLSGVFTVNHLPINLTDANLGNCYSVLGLWLYYLCVSWIRKFHLILFLNYFCWRNVPEFSKLSLHVLITFTCCNGPLLQATKGKEHGVCIF